MPNSMADNLTHGGIGKMHPPPPIHRPGASPLQSNIHQPQLHHAGGVPHSFHRVGSTAPQGVPSSSETSGFLNPGTLPPSSSLESNHGKLGSLSPLDPNRLPSPSSFDSSTFVCTPGFDVPRRSQPPPQQNITLHPVLLALFAKSPQAVLGIAAKPLNSALCKRQHIGKPEDPEERGPICGSHTMFDMLDRGAPVEGRAYPDIIGEDADAWRSGSLAEILCPDYVNPAAEDLAWRILGTDAKPPSKSESRKGQPEFWDIMRMLGYRDLSRWLVWLRAVLQGTPEALVPFKTELQSADKTQANWQPSRRKRGNPGTPQSNDSQDAIVCKTEPSDTAQVIMTATLLNTEGPAADLSLDPTSSEKITSNHIIIVSAIITRQPSKPVGSPIIARANRTQSFHKPRRPGATTRQYSSRSSPHSSTSGSTLKGFALPSTSPKRIKTSFADPNPHPSNRHSTPGVSLLDPLSHTAQLRAESATKNNWQTTGWSSSAWLDETEAKRVVMKANRRRHAPASSTRSVGIGNPSSGPSEVSRRDRTPSRSSLSLETPVESTTEPSSDQTSDVNSDTMMIDEPTTNQLFYNSVGPMMLRPIGANFQVDSASLIDRISCNSSKSAGNDQMIDEEGLTSLMSYELSDNDCLVSHSTGGERSSASEYFPTDRRNDSSTISSSSSLHTLSTSDFGIKSFKRSLVTFPMGRMILELDWGNTPIGPMECWSSTLKSMVALILASPYRMSLLWGDECVMLYNDAYVKTCARKHPGLLGQSGAQGWAELWNDLGEVANTVLQGEPYTAYDSLLFFDRDPDNPMGIRKEECYHSFSWIPVRGPTGEVEGIFNPSFETTSRVIAERRMGTLRDLVQTTLLSRTRISYIEGCLESFSKNPFDISFVIVYTCETKKSSRKASATADDSSCEGHSGRIALLLSLSGTVAVPQGHPSAAEHVDVNAQVLGPGSQQNPSVHSPINQSSSSPGAGSSSTSSTTMMADFVDDKHSVWPLQEACTLRKPIYIADLGDRADGFEKRGWSDQATSAVVMPVSTTEDAPPLAVIIYGISPRLYWTETYSLFLNLLTRQFSTGLSTIIGHEEEAQRLQDLAALDRAKTIFFTNISHELRTPLTLIVGPISEILDSQWDISPAARDRLKIVERNTQRLINLVNQLLDLSRFEAGKMAARFRSTDLSKMTADLASLFRSAMSKNRLELTVDCPDTHKRVWVDQDFFEKVIFNLLSNSMKFTRGGGKIGISVRYDASKCYIVCSDTGVGIKKEELSRVFERFHRIENSVRNAEGTGIGLALVQDIIKLHHGHLKVDSKVDQGSKFSITFYLGTAHLPADSLDLAPDTELERMNDRVIASNARRWMLGDIEHIHSHMINESSNSSDMSSSRGSSDAVLLAGSNHSLLSTAGSTVLIADDNSDMRGFLKSVLSRYFTVEEASNGVEAYQLAKAHQPDLVVSDVMMPEMDGFELLKHLKTDSDTAGISVILLSARAGSESRIEGLAAGADDYLVKPFEAKELVARINTHLQLSKMRQRLEHAVTTRTQLLIENEQKYRDLYHTFEAISMLSPVGIIQWNTSAEITFANKAFHSQSKLPTGALSAWLDQIHPEDRGRIAAEFQLIFDVHRPTQGEFRWKDGSWCLYELSPFYQEDNAFAGYLGSTTDVTQRKESERKQLEAAESRARDAEESKRQQEAFIDMTSHEIRNPLHGIHQASELLHSSLKFLHETLRGTQELGGADLVNIRHELAEDIDAVESIQLCASHQSRIADDIINVSKLSMGLLTTIKTNFDLIGRVREVLSMYSIEAQQKDVDLRLEIGEGLKTHRYISADPNRLAQVTINFLSNALRYTSTCDGPRSVTVRVDLFTKCPELRPDVRRIGSLNLGNIAGEDDLVFAKVGVQDTARGLSPDELAKLFSRFVQANPTQDQYGGSGLGLYVSHRLIENHGGFIEVISSKGQGSIFSFVIPAKRGKRPLEQETISRAFATKRGFSRTMAHEKVCDMQPASALLPSGSMPVSGGVTSRLPSPDINASPASFQPPCRSTDNSPMSAVMSSSEGMVHTPQLVASSSQVLAASAPSEPTHVLVVEDNLINVKVIKRQLTLKGYIVSVAMDGRKALNMLYADDPKISGLPPIKIVLMDIQMPVMDGLQAITELRAAEKTGTIKKRYPVIAVTGNARKEQTEQCLASGFDNICVKPYKIDDIQARMETLLAGLQINDD